jgi:hypothetical protein
LSLLLLEKTKKLISILRPSQLWLGLIILFGGFHLFFASSTCIAKTQPSKTVKQTTVVESKNSLKNNLNLKDLASQVEELMAEKKRSDALVLIKSHLSFQQKNQTELIELLNQTSEMFLFEKTQQLFEQSASAVLSDSKLAKERINSALLLEPDNISLLILKSWILLGASDCALVYEIAQNIIQLNPMNPEGQLVKAKSYLCLSNFEKYEESRATLDIKKMSILPSYKMKWNLLDLESAYKRNQQDKINDLINEIKKDKKIGLELSYWLWKIQKDRAGLESEAFLYGQKILSFCKNMTSKQQREILSEVSICKKTNEVESYLKKSSQTE